MFANIYLRVFKGRRTTSKDKRKKLGENVFMTYFEDRREQRETAYIYRTLEWFDVWGSVCVPLPPIQVTRNKAIYTYSYTIWDRVSLDTGFLATAVKNLWVVLSFNARNAIPHNTKMINNVAKAILTIYNEMAACEV